MCQCNRIMANKIYQDVIVETLRWVTTLGTISSAAGPNSMVAAPVGVRFEKDRNCAIVGYSYHTNLSADSAASISVTAAVIGGSVVSPRENDQFDRALKRWYWYVNNNQTAQYNTMDTTGEFSFPVGFGFYVPAGSPITIYAGANNGAAASDHLVITFSLYYVFTK